MTTGLRRRSRLRASAVSGALVAAAVPPAAVALPAAAVPPAAVALPAGRPPAAARPASLRVVVDGLPPGTDARVRVTGPGGFSARVTRTATSRHLRPGSYRVTGRPVRLAGGTATVSVIPTLVPVARSTSATVRVTYTVPGSGGAEGVRGALVSALGRVPECNEGAVSSSVGPLPGVDSFVVCPAGVPEETPQPVPVTADSASFDALAEALARPDEPPRPGQLCPAMAVVEQDVFASAGGRVYLVSVPTTSCGFPQPQVQAVIGGLLG